MKNLVIITLVSLLVLTTSSLFAQTTIDSKIDFVNSYVFRGVRVTDGPVLQPTLSLKRNGFTASIWNNIDIDNTNNLKDKFTKTHYVLNYTVCKEIYNVSVGTTTYDYPTSLNPSTAEAHLKVVFNTLLNPSVIITKDVVLSKGTRLDLNICDSIPLGYKHALNFSMGVGVGTNDFNKFQYNVPNNTWTDFRVSVSTTFDIEGFKVTPVVGVASLLGDVRDAYIDDKDTFIVGIGVSYPFNLNW